MSAYERRSRAEAVGVNSTKGWVARQAVDALLRSRGHDGHRAVQVRKPAY